MADSWSKLTKLTDGVRFVVERVRLLNSQIAIEGEFHLSPLAQLTADEQEFVTAFLRSRGNLREMERIFGISYPTVKNRLNRIADRLEPVESDATARSEVLAQLERGNISVEEALARLNDLADE